MLFKTKELLRQNWAKFRMRNEEFLLSLPNWALLDLYKHNNYNTTYCFYCFNVIHNRRATYKKLEICKICIVEKKLVKFKCKCCYDTVDLKETQLLFDGEKLCCPCDIIKTSRYATAMELETFPSTNKQWYLHCFTSNRIIEEEGIKFEFIEANRCNVYNGYQNNCLRFDLSIKNHRLLFWQTTRFNSGNIYYGVHYYLGKPVYWYYAMSAENTVEKIQKNIITLRMGLKHCKIPKYVALMILNYYTI